MTEYRYTGTGRFRHPAADIVAHPGDIVDVPDGEEQRYQADENFGEVETDVEEEGDGEETYRSLQQRAKERGIPANQSEEELRTALDEEGAEGEAEE